MSLFRRTLQNQYSDRNILILCTRQVQLGKDAYY